MSRTTRISTAERLGHSFGRGWRAYVRGERRLSIWLASKGIPMAGVAVLLWVVKLVALGLLFYAAFWLALLLLLGLAAAGWAMDQQHPAEDDYELQYPTIEELRTTSGYDPNLHNDTSHEMYQDD
ncbi:DUF3742 family protein [Diaphorobacter sp. J5-51]|jgi:fatty acid desaturase|uniref:DUF3742 family protein n=1 Tax=Diaphorobacter sp. J5-51 TaxID=680496 RepID=UPI000643A9DA|nr:DUF3742 family protein [Diaphorobacter sp. J5-51]KLR57361.1 hypothetical protein OX89_12825 [Diaphorobacter sp. J5-51]